MTDKLVERVARIIEPNYDNLADYAPTLSGQTTKHDIRRQTRAAIEATLEWQQQKAVEVKIMGDRHWSELPYPPKETD